MEPLPAGFGCFYKQIKQEGPEFHIPTLIRAPTHQSLFEGEWPICHNPNLLHLKVETNISQTRPILGDLELPFCTYHQSAFWKPNVIGLEIEIVDNTLST